MHARRDASKDAELLVLRHENAVTTTARTRTRARMITPCTGPVLFGISCRPPMPAVLHLISQERVPLENRILVCELRLLGSQAARAYSFIRPLRTGFRRIWRAWKSPAV